MSEKTVKQIDIARRLGISRSLVSGVLSGSTRTGSSAVTQRRIHETAREMGYVVNEPARMFKTGKTNCVSFPCVMGDGASTYAHYAEAISALAHKLGRSGYRIEINAFDNQNSLLEWLPNAVHAKSRDAIVLWGLDEEVVEQAEVLDSLDFPFVVRGHHDSRPNWIQAEYDHKAMMRVALEKLIAMGHERIAFVGHSHDGVYSRQFRDGFREACGDLLGADIPPEWMLLSAEDAESGRSIVRRVSGWADTPEAKRPTAIVCGPGGGVLIRIEIALMRRGILIGNDPGQIAAAGFFTSDPFIAGSGWNFHHLSALRGMYDGLIGEMAASQLIPLLAEGHPKQRMLSLLPELRPSRTRIFGDEGDIEAILKIETG